MSRPIAKLLVANRGEIACRVMRTARRMGVATVAIFSDADRDALHVAMADEAVHVGPAPAAESYLDGARIIAAAHRTGAGAIHPGYGFLSENADFAMAVENAGLVFVGPGPDAIRAMGLKDAAKALMQAAGVPVVPGYHGADQDEAALADHAAAIGYPVLIKARAGGGGKGMRKVDRPTDFHDALAAARREARSAFGDDRVLIETFIRSPRHVEMQVFGDRHGTVVHLFERDCSLQRRHQKIVEEAPAPGMNEETRQAMGRAAIDAARAIGYVGAGTVEFIVDAREGLRPDRFWFMEMNTRLQVEHPVTEAITGIDLVEWQLRVAAGEALPLAQADIRLRGHAVEARLYAEDPARSFQPATGVLGPLVFPQDGVRVDTGVREGDRITPYYDPLIAKFVVHADTREVALAQMAAGLRSTQVGGAVTNIAFLGRLIDDADVRAARLDTELVGRKLETLTVPEPAAPELVACAALIVSRMAEFGGADPFVALGPWQIWGRPARTVRLGEGLHARAFTVSRLAGGQWQVQGHDADEATALTLDVEAGADAGRLGCNGHSRNIRWRRTRAGLLLFADGKTHVFALADEASRTRPEAAGGDLVRAPMPGVIRQMSAAAGDTVAAGQPLALMEAMKMEVTLAAPRSGVVAEACVAAGDQVEEGTVVLRLAPADAHGR